MLFASWVKSEYARNSIKQSKCCLDRVKRANMHEIQWISQNVVYIMSEERIYTKFNESVKMLFTSWVKSEYAWNLIFERKVVSIVWKERIYTKFKIWAKMLFTLLLKREYAWNSINQSKCCLHREWRGNMCEI
jgi:hypothetical protein